MGFLILGGSRLGTGDLLSLTVLSCQEGRQLLAPETVRLPRAAECLAVINSHLISEAAPGILPALPPLVLKTLVSQDDVPYSTEEEAEVQTKRKFCSSRLGAGCQPGEELGAVVRTVTGLSPHLPF